MRPRSFEYHAVSTLNEALQLLQTTEDAKILAGGQSLIALMKFRVFSPKSIIDIGRLNELIYVREESDVIKIGALTTHDGIENNDTIRRKLPLLVDAVRVIADQQGRNRGTIGGSLAHADPSADITTALVALNASVVLIGLEGSRSLDCSEFLTGYFSTALKPNEVIKEISIPSLNVSSGGAYLKLSRRHGDFAIVGAAAVVTLNDQGTCAGSSVVLGGVAETPWHATGTEKALLGQQLTEATIDNAAEEASDGLKPLSDVHASAEYRLEMSRVMTKRAIKMAVKRATEGSRF